MAETCTITGTILNGDGTPNSDVQITATVESTEDDMGGQVVGTTGVTSTAIEAFTEDDGTFEIVLLQGGRYLLEIPPINLRKVVAVPEETEADFVAII